MATEAAHIVLRHIRRLAAPRINSHAPDRELLTRFCRRGDTSAFEELLHRHGPMVLRVGRRLLSQRADAEEVFQATFLTLTHKAASIRRQDSVAAWLHGVAYRLALRLRKAQFRRTLHERQAPERPAPDPLDEITLREALGLLDQELGRLPERLRAPLVLCYLEGVTRDEAAGQLGWSRATIQRRLDEGRELLGRRLARRGLTLSAALLGTVLTEQAAMGTVSGALLTTTVQAATMAANGALATGVISARTAALVNAALRTATATKLKALAAVLLAVSLVTGAGLAGRQALALSDAEQRSEGDAPAAKAADPPKTASEPGPRTDRYGDSLPDGALLRLGTVRLRHKEWLAAVAFAPGGKPVASGAEGGIIRLWDPSTGKELRHIEGHDGRLASLAFSPDGALLASAGSKAVYLWDPVTGKKLREFANETTTPIEGGVAFLGAVPLVFSRDGKTLASVNSVGGVRVWDVATGKQRIGPLPHEKPVAALGFSPDGKTLVTATGIRAQEVVIRRWELATGRELQTVVVPTEKDEDLSPFAFSLDGTTLVLAGWEFVRRGNEYHIHLWDVDTGKQGRRLDAPEDVIWSAAFSPDGKLIAAGGRDHVIRVWDTATGQKRRELPGFPGGTRPDGGAYTLSFSPDGKTLAAVGSSAAVHLWDVTTGRELLAKPDAHHADITALTYSRDGRLIASGGNDYSVRVWDAATGQQRHVLQGHRQSVRGLAFSPDGKLLASASLIGELRLWETATGKRLHAIQVVEHVAGVYYGITPVAFTPDGKTLVSWGDDRKIRLWDVTTGKERSNRPIYLSGQPQVPAARPQNMPPFAEQLLAVEFSPDARFIAIAIPRFIHVLDVRTGQEIMKLPSQQVFARLAFSPDGKTLLAGGWDRKIRLWELATGKELLQAECPDHINAVAFAADGRSVAAAPGWANSTIHLFNVANGKRLRQLQGHGSRVDALAFSPDGRGLASGALDTAVLIWDVAPAQQHTGLRTKKLNAKELERLWADLADADARKAHTAIWTLVSALEHAVALLKDRLKPAPKTDPKRIRQLIAELDSDKFAVREAAFKALQDLGLEAEPALRKVLQENPSAEVQKRIDALLSSPPPRTTPSSELLRRLRAVTALEQIGSEEARQALIALANGAPGAELTRDAKAALERLAKRPTVTP